MLRGGAARLQHRRRPLPDPVAGARLRHRRVGFALAVEFWGSGMFVEGAELVVDFAFRTLGVYRLEARAVVRNGRGNGALRKIGAVNEGVLRRSFLRNGELLDQALWTILADEWFQAKATWGTRVIH